MNKIKGPGVNKTLYIRQADVAAWDKAAKLLPFYKGQTVSQFCTMKIKEAVSDLEGLKPSARIRMRVR